MANKDDESILKEARERLAWCIADDEENRRDALEDLKFLDGDQWPADIKASREADKRPCITINKMPTFVDQVTGDQRQNRPKTKVIPVDSHGDPFIAEIYNGIINHIEQISDAEIPIDHAFEHTVACAYGSFRVITEYTDDESFDQDIKIKKIDNPLSVYWGPHTEYDCSDAPYCFIISDITREEYKSQHGDDPMPFNAGDSAYVEGWCSENTVRIAEYFTKEPIDKTIYLLSDGRIVDEITDGDEVIKQRKVKGHEVRWYKLSGNKVLKRSLWAGKKYIPVISVWGKELNVGGKRKIRGLIRNAKDPQRLYNYWTSCDTEQVALAPKAPYLATPKQIKGHENQWNNPHKNHFYMLVNPDDKAPGWPQRQAPPQASSAMVQKISQADQEMRDTAGLQRASLGMQGNERSGSAIRERKKEGDTGTFAFIDNLARSRRYLGRVLIDAIPAVYDTDRIIRLGLDGSVQKFVAINQRTMKDDGTPGPILNDLSIGKYDVVVSIGPSFETQRTEARESMGEFIQYYPQAAPYIGDLYAKSMDWPGADEMAERLAYLLPPEIREEKKRKEDEAAGKQPEVDPQQAEAHMMQTQAMQQAQMAAEIELKTKTMELEELTIKVEQEKEKLKGLELDNAIKASQGKENIKTMIEEILTEEE